MKRDWRQGILYLTIIGMQGCWLYAVLSLLNEQVTQERLAVPGILALYPVAFIVNTMLGWLKWRKVVILGVSWLAGIAGMLLLLKIQLFGNLPVADTQWLLAVPQSIAAVVSGFRPELLLLLSTGIIWWLSQRLAFRSVSFTTMVSEFQFGFTMLVLLFLIALLLEVSTAHAVPVVIIFFLLALLGISIAHAMEGNSWLSGRYQGHWSGLLLISISVILLLGLLISWLVTPELLQLVWTALKWLLGLIWAIILKILLFIARLFPEPGPAEALPPVPGMPSIEPREELNLFTMPEWLRNALRLLLNTVWIGLIVIAVWRVCADIFRWLRHRLAGMAGVELEPLHGAFRADFFGFLIKIFAWLRLPLPFLLRTRPEPALPEILSIRQTYRKLLHWAAAGGYPRHLAQTPYEYLGVLGNLLPQARDDFAFITRQYVKTRYGTSLPTKDELQQIDQSWHNVRQNKLKRRDAA